MSTNLSAAGAAGPAVDAPKPKLRRFRLPDLSGVIRFLTIIGFGWVVPIMKIAAGENPRPQLQELWRQLGIPLLAIVAFLVAWGQIAPQIQTSLGAVPGPAQVWEQVGVLYADHVRQRDKADAFYERQEERNAKLEADGRTDRIKWRDYTGKPTYVDQIFTSLKTVFTGFVLASVIAIRLGILCGLSPSMNAAFNPLIQIFKPVSPLAWLPIVTMVVSAVYTSSNPMFDKSFLNSALTVTLCSLWPALINTTLGVASIDKDLLNVGKVLQLGWRTQVTKLVLPSALPLIFTGLRLSLGVGWMVLIAAEMLAQNPGLGKFVWDEFQNGSSDSLARIMVAVFTIGIIGFLLDRLMYALQAAVTYGNVRRPARRRLRDLGPDLGKEPRWPFSN
jgi:nitrate/nitrite transport system permease protein